MLVTPSNSPFKRVRIYGLPYRESITPLNPPSVRGEICVDAGGLHTFRFPKKSMRNSPHPVFPQVRGNYQHFVFPRICGKLPTFVFPASFGEIAHISVFPPSSGGIIGGFLKITTKKRGCLSETASYFNFLYFKLQLLFLPVH